MRIAFLVIVPVLVVGLSSAASAQDLGAQAMQVLAKNCHACHGQAGSKEGGMDYITDRDRLLAGKKIVPGKPQKSRLYLRISSKDNPMPPEDEKQRPSSADVELVRKWIEAGTPAPKTPLVAARPFVSLKDVFTAIDKHLDSLQKEDRPYQRYFSLTHLHNLQSVPAGDFRLYRAALSKLVNSLSWKPEIVLPKAVDKHRTVFAIDLRDLDWDRHALWQRILEVYPYGLKHDHYPADKTINDLARRVYRTTGTDVPIVRADWFIATASRPPLYHALLQIPKTARELETSLKVDVQGNFRRNRLARAGFARSGVSSQNRLIERHTALYGAYWISYDFKPKNPLGNLFRYPLGPAFKSNPFNRQAFAHDGGEIIFHLPNGLQGYMLVDAKGNRIDEGPIDVVRDKQEVAGSPAIVNGVSCMACHQHGMIADFKDTVRAGTAVAGEALRKVRLLYPKPETINALVAKDQKRFLDALDKAIGPFLRVGNKTKADVKDLGEPVGKIAKWYLREDLGAAEIAAELGLKDAKTIVMAIKFNARLKALGLGPLAAGNRIKREAWEELRGTSTFQKTASELDLGTPVVYARRKQ